MDNSDYLNSVAQRATDYNEIRLDVLDYILENKIKDVELASDLFIVGFLWLAHRRDEILTHDDFSVFLGSDDSIYFNEFDTIDTEYFLLKEDEAQMDLIDLLDLTVQSRI